MKNLPFQIVNFRPSHGWAVAERFDGRQYDVELVPTTLGGSHRVVDVYAVGIRRQSVDHTGIGIAIHEEVMALVRAEAEEFFLYGGYGGERRLYSSVD